MIGSHIMVNVISISGLCGQVNRKIIIPTTTQNSPMYCIALIFFFVMPNHPNLSIAKLLANNPHILVTNSTPMPVLAAKKANPVTKVPPIIPPNHDHQGLSCEKMRGIWILFDGINNAIPINTMVAVKKEINAACTEEYSPIESRLFMEGCKANTAPPLKPIICHISLLSPLFGAFFL